MKDAVDTHRRALPMAEVGKEYVFAGPREQASLADLFDGRRQLIFLPLNVAPPQTRASQDARSWQTTSATCPICVPTTPPWSWCPAPLASIGRFQQRMGWPVPWYSSPSGDFNYDFHVSFDEDAAPLEYNYKDKAALERDHPYIRSGRTRPG